MKKLLVLPILLFLLSCNGGNTPDDYASTDSLPSEKVPEPLPDSTVARFSDLEVWLGDLLSDKKETRSAAFEKYMSVRDTSDGETSELMTGYIKTFFSTYPKEFLTHYAMMSKRRKENAIDDVAYEFYASGDAYKADLDEYFQGIQNSCSECSASQMNTLKVVKQKIYDNVARMNR
jgi:hypothetical protein